MNNVPVPKTPCTDLLNAILTKYAFPRAIEKLAAAGFAPTTQEEFSKQLLIGKAVVDRVVAVKAASAKLRGLDAHVVKVASVLRGEAPGSVDAGAVLAAMGDDQVLTLASQDADIKNLVEVAAA